jgi:hypothetical protein
MGEVSALPTRLYKYRKFNTSTLRLITKAESYYADPETFNDPLDCRPVIQLDTDTSTLEKVCYRMLVLVHDKKQALSTMTNFRYLSSEHGDYKKDQAATWSYTQGLRQEIKRLLYDEMRKCGVLSLGARWDCPLMWSHYADEHRGLCIEYDMTNHHCERLFPVDYGASGNVKVSNLYDWKLHGSMTAEILVRGAFFYAKARQWRYEREWRDVVGSNGVTDTPLTVSAILFGLRCDSAVVTSVVKLFTNSSAKPKFYDVYRKDEGFRLKRRAVDVDEIEACGLRTATRWDFDRID